MRAVIRPGTSGALMLFLAVAGASFGTGTTPAAAGESLTLAVGQSTAPSYTAGIGLSSLVKFELLPRNKIDLTPLESKGAIDNVRRLQAGEADFAILPSAIGHAARLGIGSFEGEPPATGFRAIATLWRDALHLVMREDDTETGTLDDLSALKDRKLFLGDSATGVIDANRLLLSDLGMEAERTFELAAVADGDGIAAIKRGEIDAFSSTARPPEAMFQAVFADSGGLRLLDVTEQQMTRANGNHWLWTPYVIPAATYPGQGRDIATIALSNLLVVRADVAADTVYAITRSLFENLPYLRKVDPMLADLSLENALAGVAMPLHAGALRYYQEAELISKPTPADTSPTPGLTPVREQERHPGGTPEERYPGSDVAEGWPAGVGGPLLRARPADASTDVLTPAEDAEPADTLAPVAEPHWRKRATL